MAKIEDRAVDSGVAQLRGKDDAAAVEWWKQRFALIAGIPTEVARAGALLPQMRELSRLPEAERRRLTKLRMQAFTAVASDQRQIVMSARKLTYAFDPELVKSDDQIVQQLVPEVPGAADIAQQMGR
jgi:hypothetical protein